MNFEKTFVQVRFAKSSEIVRIPLADIYLKTLDFLERFGEPHLVGKKFHGIIGDGAAEVRLERLISAASFKRDPAGFFTKLAERLCQLNGTGKAPLTVNGVEIPVMLSVWLLELFISGDRFVSVKDVSRFEVLANCSVPETERAALQKVIDTYPVRISTHAFRQMRVSEAVRYQYAPFIEESDPEGRTDTWVGRFNQGVVERMYRNRVIFLLGMSCPVYCRFCFRKHKDLRNRPAPSVEDVLRAVDYVRKNPAVEEILITGGDPFLARENMRAAIDGLKDIPHVGTLRLATRSVSYYPDLFLGRDGFWLRYLKMKNLELGVAGKRIELATHFIHPDEVSIQSLQIISELVSSGIQVYVQTPFLNDCNDRGPELSRLFSLLRGAGAEMHYIFTPCSPIKGNSVYSTPISRAFEAACYLRAHLSDRAIPGICTATAIGKIDWFSSGWAVERDGSEPRFVWIRTPYTRDFFKSFNGTIDDPGLVRVNPEGTLDVRFPAGIGDESCFTGNRTPARRRTEEKPADALPRLQRAAVRSQKIGCSIVPVGNLKLARCHETRVELAAGSGGPEMDYIRNDDRITDVLVSAEDDMIDHLQEGGLLIEKLKDIRHVISVRLRSLKFNYSPESYSGAVVSRFAEFQSFSIARPLRLEIETQFLHSDEIFEAHRNLASRLRTRGITVYANLPLLSGVNATAREVDETARRLREAGVEFHHLYLAGLPIQKKWCDTYPIDVSRVTDIASGVRMEASGRGIPKYIILTELGEVDFGLTSRLVRKDGSLAAILLPYNLDYYRGMDPGFDWPRHIESDSLGRPIVPVPGLTSFDDFMIFCPGSREA